MKSRRQRTELPFYVTRKSDLAISRSDAEQPSSTSRWEQVANGAQYVFAVPADRDKLDELCNKFLNEPQPNEPQHGIKPLRHEYRASTAHVFLVFEQNGIMQSGAGPAAARFTYATASIWIPAKRSPNQAVFFPFYFFVSKEGYPLIASIRESDGWPAEPATVTLPAASNGDLSVEATLLETFSRDTKAKCDCLIRVSQQNTKQPLGKLEPIIHALGGDFGPRLSKALDGEPVSLDVKFALLKQFRDTAHPQRACYQAVVEADARADVETAQFLDTFKLEIKKADSHPIVKEFGVQNLDEILGVKLSMTGKLYGARSRGRSAD